MKNVLKVLLLIFVAALTACGGGGGGSSSLVYDGESTPATITAENASDLAALAYYGSQLAEPLPLSMSQTVSSASGSPMPVLQEVVDVVSGLPKKIDLTMLNDNVTRATMSIPASTEQCGFDGNSGTMTVSGTFDMETGAVNAKIAFSNCDSGDGVVMNGSIGVQAAGIDDLEDPDFTDFTVTFNRLSYEFIEDGQEIILDGTAVGSVDNVSSAQIMTLNLVMMETSSGQMAKVEDYTVSVVDNFDYQEVSISGRIYDSSYGYIDITTVEPILTDFGNPYQGIYRIDGADGTWATVDFSIEVGPQGAYGAGAEELGTFSI